MITRLEKGSLLMDSINMSRYIKVISSPGRNIIASTLLNRAKNDWVRSTAARSRKFPHSLHTTVKTDMGTLQRVGLVFLSGRETKLMGGLLRSLSGDISFIEWFRRALDWNIRDVSVAGGGDCPQGEQKQKKFEEPEHVLITDIDYFSTYAGLLPVIAICGSKVLGFIHRDTIKFR